MKEEAKTALWKAAEKRWKRVKGKRYGKPLEEGQLVLLRVPGISKPQERLYSKFIPLYTGPYRIRTSFKNHAYELETIQDNRTLGRYNSASLKLYYTPDE